MKFDRVETGQSIDGQKVKNVNKSSAVPGHRAYLILVILLCIMLLLISIFNFSTPHEDNSPMFADARNYSAELEKMGERVGRVENIYVQLAENVSVATPRIDNNEQRIDREEAAIKTFKVEIADNRKTSLELRERLAQDENTYSQLAEKLAVATKIIDDLAQRIGREEATSKTLKDEIADSRKTSSDLRERLVREENTYSQLAERLSTATEKIDENAQRIGHEEATSKTMKDEIADTRKTSSDLRERLARDENTHSQLAEKLSNAMKKIDDSAQRISHEEATSVALARFAVKENECMGNYEAMGKALLRFAVRNNTAEPLADGSGKVDWKLSEYKSKVNDAFLRTKTNVIVIGPSFYTVGIGYKFGTCLKFDGETIWVAVYPLKGMYDDFIKWPFVGRLTFSLLDRNVMPTNTFISPTDASAIAPCLTKAYERNFDDEHPYSCSFKMEREEELKKKGLIKDDSLFIRVEVESA